MRSLRWPIVLVLLCTLGVYARALPLGFVWDDGPALVQNSAFNPPTRATLGYYWTHASWNLYQPLTCTLWAVCAKLGYVPTPDSHGVHLSPLPFHLLNVALHLLATVGVYRLLRLLRIDVQWAAVGAGLFGLHPIQVESVAFIGQLNTPLYGCLAVFALVDFLAPTASDQGAAHINENARRSRWVYVRGSVLYGLAVLSQPVAIVVPVIGIALDRLLLRRSWNYTIRRALPWILFAIPLAVWTRMNQHGAVVAAQSPTWSRPLVAMDNLAVQTFHVLWPVGLTVDYGRTPVWLLAHPLSLLTGLFTLAMMALAWLLRRRRPLTTAGLVLAGVALLPSSGIIPFDFEQFSSVADRHAYFAMIGFAMVFIDTLMRLPRPVSLTSAMAILLVLIGVTFHQIGFWQNDRTLFARGVRLNPHSWLCHQNLGAALLVTNPQAAMAQFKAAIELIPAAVGSYDSYAMAALNANDPAAAVPVLRAGLRLSPHNPNLHAHLADALKRLGQPKEAAEQLRLSGQDAPVGK